MIEWLNQGWIGSLIGIIGVVLGVMGLLAYRVSRIGARLVFQTHARRLIGRQEQELPEEVQVVYNGNNVPRLTLSRVVFWNSGTITISGEYIIASDPLRLEFNPEDKLLKVRVVKVSRPVINFQARQDTKIPNRVLLSFDYLDPQDGGVVELLHTSERRHPSVCGSIRGIPNGIRNYGDISGNIFMLSHFHLRLNTPRLLKIATIAMMLITGFTMFALALYSKNILASFASSGHRERIIFTFLGLIYIVMPTILLWGRRRRYPRKLHMQEI